MTTQKLYLRQNIQVEPLVNFWYAWPYLISPVTTAMMIANSQNRIMESYIQAPELHEEALKKPEFLGGPFIDFEVRQVDAIKKLMHSTNTKCSNLLELVASIKDLNNLLKKADGYTLEPLYLEIPDLLKGYVELVYDLNNIPTFRLIEGLFYESDFYIDHCQSVLLTIIEQDYRSFVFSTPRLPQKNQILINLSFNSLFYDKLFEMKNTSQTKDYIIGLLDILPNKDEINEELFLSFFTEYSQSTQRLTTNLAEDNVSIYYFGHACLLIESKNCTILIDPIISYKYENGIERYTYSDLPDKIDYLLITHAHIDHVLIEHLLQLRYKVKTVVVPKSGVGVLQDPSLKLFFKNIGYNNVVEIDDLETIEVAGGSITGIPFFGEHGDLNIQTKKAYIITQNCKTILCAADSNNIEPKVYTHVQKKFDNIDVIFIGMECDGAPLSWMYGAILPSKLHRNMDQSRRLNGSDYNKAIDLVNQFNCKQAYVYAMGQEPWLNYVTTVKYYPDSKPILESDKFVEECKKRGITSERLFGKKEIHI